MLLKELKENLMVGETKEYKLLVVDKDNHKNKKAVKRYELGTDLLKDNEYNHCNVIDLCFELALKNGSIITVRKDKNVIIVEE